MIRTNLSTRPFYNERAVRLWLLVRGDRRGRRHDLQRHARRCATRAATRSWRRRRRRTRRAPTELRRTAASLRASVDARQIDAASVDARQANDLIDRRTFSWTELFNQFEATLPDDVRITSVRPTLDQASGASC